MYRDGAAQHQFVRIDQGQWLRRLHYYVDSEIHKPDDYVLMLDAPPQDRPLRFEARGVFSRFACDSHLTWLAERSLEAPSQECH